MEKEIVLLKKLDECAVIPTYAYEGDIGLDLVAIDVEYNEEHDYYVYHTGIVLANDYGKGFLIFPRSSIRDMDCYLTNSVGLCDTAVYRGEIMLTFKNRTSFEVRKALDKLNFVSKMSLFGAKINHHYSSELNPIDFAPYKVGEKIGQLVLAEFPKVEFKVVAELNETDRGTGGHGSSGK